MAQYSSVKKPAFFIPFMDYAQSIGNVEYQDDELNDIHLLNPAKTHRITEEDGWWDGGEIQYDIDFKKPVKWSNIADTDNEVYIFILGHNFASTDCSIKFKFKDDEDIYTDATSRTSIINDNGDGSAPTYNGFSILKTVHGNNNVWGLRIIIKGHSAECNGEIKIGCVSLCSKWNPPRTPDLNLKINREYDGVKTITTKGGATLSNAQYTRGGTFWATSYAWELPYGEGTDAASYTEDNGYIKSQRTLGRRNWDLKFSYINDSDLMPEFESWLYYETEYTDTINKSIKDSHSFFARVLNRVQGSHLPFIFLPNDTDPNYNPDQWAIVRFDQSEFDINQVANSVYDISLKLTEVW